MRIPRAVRAFLIVGLLLVGGLMMCFAGAGVFRSPEGALAVFSDTTRQVGEDQIADPLFMTGRRSVPIVTNAVQDRAFPYRRYALSYLAWASDSRALSTLEAIFADTSEIDYFRSDALEGIACIRAQRADSLATQIAGDTGILGMTARMILDGPKCPIRERSFWDAMFGYHD
jgi:hypothetical protein